jgi:hypothetical protein
MKEVQWQVEASNVGHTLEIQVYYLRLTSLLYKENRI